MSHAARIACLVVGVAALVGCEGHNEAATSGTRPEDTAVGWSSMLDQDVPELLAKFRGASERYGCETKVAEPEVVSARCPEGPIVVQKKGLKVTVACARMSLDACQGLFHRISTTH
jgi:hypothetical protein